MFLAMVKRSSSVMKRLVTWCELGQIEEPLILFVGDTFSITEAPALPASAVRLAAQQSW